MKQVAIHAYPFGNVGDDLFIRTLCQRYPHVQFHLTLHMDYAKTFQDIPNITLHPSNSMVYRLRTWLYKNSHFPMAVMRNIDATVYIGGSLFMEQVDWKKAFIQMKLMHDIDKPFFIIGANFGPYRSNTFLEAHEDFFKQITSISFRDHFSHSLFHHLDNVGYAPDVIFNLYGKLKESDVPSTNHLLISVIYPSVRKHLMFTDERYFANMARLVEDAHQQHYSVTLTAFCPYEKDDEAVEEILKRVSPDVREQVRVHIYTGNLDEVYRLFQQATHVVATRFHAMILGWLFEKNVLPITYSEKMDNVLDDISFVGEFRRIEEVDAHLSALVCTNEHAHIDLSSLAEEAEHHFTALDRFLRRE